MGNGSNSNRTNNDTSYETVQEVKEELKEEEKQETVKTKEKEESEENEEPKKVTISKSDYTKDCLEYKYNDGYDLYLTLIIDEENGLQEVSYLKYN